jgi:hypothetical protein
LRAVAPPAAGNLASVGPVCAVLRAVCVEYERVANPKTTVGVAATNFSVDGDRWTSVDLKYRYFPDARAPFGVGLAGSVGYLHSGPAATDGRLGLVPLTVDAFAVAAGADLNHPLGRARRLVLGAGAGYKLLVAGERFQRQPCSLFCLNFDARVAPSVAAFPYLRATVAAAF